MLPMALLQNVAFFKDPLCPLFFHKLQPADIVPQNLSQRIKIIRGLEGEQSGLIVCRKHIFARLG